MIKFYLKIQNKILSPNLLYILTLIILFANLIIRVFPRNFINIPQVSESNMGLMPIIPTFLFTCCDVYLLMLLIILMFFFLGIDFDNSMEDIALASGRSKINKLFARKLTSLLSLYFVLYAITFANVYTTYLNLIYGKGVMIPFKEIVSCSLTTNLFIVSLSLVILLISRNIAVSISLISAYYLIEEALWKCKITQTNGILGHIYHYSNYHPGELYSVKVVYIFFSLVLLFISYKISKRKLNIRLYGKIRNRTQ